MASTWEEFYWRYNSLPPLSRHYYEIIEAGKPCRTYFDIEYDITLNPEVNGDRIVDIFIREICNRFAIDFGIFISRSNVLDLDSSTDVKFSRHLIVHLKYGCYNDHNANDVGNIDRYSGLSTLSNYNNLNDRHGKVSLLWENNIILGEWIQAVVKDIRTEIQRTVPYSHPLSSLFLKSRNNADDDNHVFLADLNVYTRNRAMRMFMSSKYEKKVPLLIATSNSFPVDVDSEDGMRQAMRDSLITNFITNSREGSDTANDKFCYVPYKSKGRSVVIKSADECIASGKKKCIRVSADDLEVSPGALSQGGTWPHIANLDTFILVSFCQLGGVQGEIRSIHSDNSIERYITYEIGRNRYCRKINREHKSNHIFIGKQSTLAVCNHCV